mmetsp:Transcript_56066/g.119363  ORF Transcript_56066/g.119363 Transcript_56066/m.119363 type:complete len:383 (-) Transcript_56066:157-1305(-)
MGDGHGTTDSLPSVVAEASLSKVLVEVLALKLVVGDLKEGQDVLLHNLSSLRRKILQTSDGGGSPTTSISPERSTRTIHGDKNVSFKPDDDNNTVFSSADRISNLGWMSDFSGRKASCVASMSSTSSMLPELSLPSWPRNYLPRPAFTGDLEGRTILTRDRSKSQVQMQSFQDGFRRPARSMSSGLQKEDSVLSFALRTRNCKCCVLNPNSSFTSARELLSGLALCYDLAVVPFLMAWDIPLRGSDENSPYGIPTASLRHVFAGVVEEGQWNKLPKIPSRQHIRRCSTENRQTRFLKLNSYANFGFASEEQVEHVKDLYLGTGNEPGLYMWLPQKAWEWYSHKTSGQQRVDSLLAEFDFSDEVIRSLQEQSSYQPEVQQLVV